MKKTIAFVLALTICAMLFAACGDTTPATTQAPSTPISTTPVQTEASTTTTTPAQTEATTTAPIACTHEFEQTDTIAAGYLQDEILIYTCSRCGEEKRETGEKGIDSIKILAVGNSFSVDAMEFLWDICAGAGFREVVLGNLYIGGCTLDMHADNIEKNSAAYTYYYNDSGIWETTTKVTLDYGLTAEDWDFITIQQGSPVSGLPETYTKLPEIVSYLDQNKTNDDAEILWHMTWAYQGGSSVSGFENYGKDQQTMYDAILNTVKETVLTTEGIDGFIPSGTAVQNLRTSYLGDKITRDGYHLKYDIGRYLAGLTWFAKLTGLSASELTKTPTLFYRELYVNTPALAEAADNAAAEPFAVTPCTKTQRDFVTETKELTAKEAAYLTGLGYDPEKYLSLELSVSPYAQYQSTVNATILYRGNGGISTLSLFHATRVFEKEELPNGSLITIESGYLYFPHAWTDPTRGSTRPARTTDAVIVVDDAWWGDASYRAFDFAKADLKTPITREEMDVFKIFVPKA